MAEKSITTNVRIVSNSKSDGKLRIKMATIGERNHNGMIIKNEDSITFEDKEYLLFFEHKRDVPNIIGSFTPLGVSGNDLLAEAEVTNANVIPLIDSGALRNASITYAMTDYYYDEEQDAIIVESARLVELSLVVNPADDTAQILNTLKEDTKMDDKMKNPGQEDPKDPKDKGGQDDLMGVIDEKFEELKSFIEEKIEEAVADIKGESDDDKKDKKDKDGAGEDDKPEDIAQNARKEINDLISGLDLEVQ